MSFLDRLKGIVNIDAETDYYGDDEYEEYDEGNDYEGYDDEPEGEEAPQRKPVFSFRGAHNKQAGGNVYDFNREEAAPARPGVKNPKIVLAKPVTFDECTSIADHVKENHLVILNLETTANDVAHKIVTFLSGVSYAKDGRIDRVSTKTFVVSPSGYDVSGDLLENISNGYYM